MILSPWILLAVVLAFAASNAGIFFYGKDVQENADKAARVYDGVTPLSADDVAETVYWVTTLPAHVNINTVEMMPTCQAAGPFNVVRSPV
jgi:3-hydroxy acid dehydrogenase/malonic semialdehyde reductase